MHLAEATRLCSDTALMQRAQAGDEHAFGILVTRYTNLVEHTARRVAPTGAEDVAQQAFLSAWLGRHRFDPLRGSVRSWLCGIAQNRAIDLYRRDARRGEQFPVDPDEDDLVCPRERPADVASRRARAAEIRRAVGRLSQEQRTVIGLAYFAGLSQTEIQERTQAPLGTVKSRVRLALAALREDLAAA